MPLARYVKAPGIDPNGKRLPVRQVMYRPGEMGHELVARSATPTGAHTAAKIALYRYLLLLERARGRVRFERDEAETLVHALREYDPNRSDMLDVFPAYVESQIRKHDLDTTYGADWQALTRKVKAMGDAEIMAVVDQVERFWLAPDEPGRLETVGLVHE